MAVLCFALLQRRCERRCWVGGISCDWAGKADGLVLRARSGVLVIGILGKVWWSVLSFVEYSLAVLCFALLRRRCERRCWVGGIFCGWTGEVDCLVLEARSGVLVIGSLGKVWWSVLSFVEFSLGLAEILELDLSFI